MSDELQARLLLLARARLKQRPGDFERLCAFLRGKSLTANLLRAGMWSAPSVGGELGPAQNDAELLEFIDKWAAANTTAPVAPLDGDLAAAANAGEKWTPQRIADARAMREQLKREGRRDYARRTAEHFGVAPQRLRKVLGPDAQSAPAPKLAGWPPSRKVQRRLK